MSGYFPFTVSLQTRHHSVGSATFPIALNPLGGNVGIGTTDAGNYQLYIVGNTRADQFYEASGLKFKENIADIDSPLDKVIKLQGVTYDGLVKSLLGRHPGEPRIRSGASAGVQTSSRRKSGTISKTGSRFSPGTLDSGFRRNDGKARFLTFYESITYDWKRTIRRRWRSKWRYLWPRSRGPLE
jgi:hypothetical protein